MKATSTPHLLLVEDDMVSAAFLIDALSALPAQVEHAATLQAANACTRHSTHALWLIDANLPDGRGEDWLRAQRQRGHTTPALALTAEVDRQRLAGLDAAGFREVLPKPLSVALLQATVRRVLGHAETFDAPLVGDKQPLWDEAQALRALAGDRAAITTLRSLFLQELPKQCETVLTALADGRLEAARAILHQLKASTAFVGAARITQAVQALSAQPQSQSARQAFENAVKDYRAAPSEAVPDRPSAPMT